MTERLTPNQRMVLAQLDLLGTPGVAGAELPDDVERHRARTIATLEARGLIEWTGGYPPDAWELTDAGRAALGVAR